MFNTSNATPQDMFLMALQDQLVDLQDYVYRSTNVGRESRYFFIVFETQSCCKDQDQESQLLNHIFHHRLRLQPHFFIWRTTKPFDSNTPVIQQRAYIQFNRPVAEQTLQRFLRTDQESPFHLRWFTTVDSYEFIQAIVQWVPSASIRVWSRFVHPIEPDFTVGSLTIPFTESVHYTDDDGYQDKIREMWSERTLVQLLEINYD